ncbi:MAG: SDR family oxidoreductase [Streptosporangiales bacterium]|nr:SDR family oxidoreductase [Streptosporangiales bacterium]
MSGRSRVGVLREGALAGYGSLVTGAGTGIGRAIALRLVELGASVTGLGRRADKLAETAELAAGAAGRAGEAGASGAAGSFRFRSCDVRDEDEVVAAIDEAGGAHGLDLVVNNAGGQFFAQATRISPNGWRAVLDLNLTAIFTVLRAAHPYLARHGGSVVNISLSGVERGGMGMAHSIAARSGVLGLTRTLALEWAADGIRLNCVGPGTVLTEGLSEEAAEHSRRSLIGKATPMRRATTAEEVAELVAYLMTGQLVQVDGGAHLGPGLHMLPEKERP